MQKAVCDFIGGGWVKPAGGEYFDNVSPITSEALTSIPRSREADIELALDAAHRAQEGSISEIDHDTVAYHFHEPPGVVGQIIPWNFPILMAYASLRPHSPPATAWCSSRPSKRPLRFSCWSN